MRIRKPLTVLIILGISSFAGFSLAAPAQKADPGPKAENYRAIPAALPSVLPSIENAYAYPPMLAHLRKKARAAARDEAATTNEGGSSSVVVSAYLPPTLTITVDADHEVVTVINNSDEADLRRVVIQVLGPEGERIALDRSLWRDIRSDLTQVPAAFGEHSVS